MELADDAKFLNFSSNAQALVTSPFGNALKTTAEALAADFRASVNPPNSAATARASEASARSLRSDFHQ